ncbi:unannotated protein [freshwater metagenome]|uniref:Unannotated protein n=1 Tax=freshwater metagenome TaxID=449393 RepID=A0A6J7BK90_9ZZZZ
MLTPVILALKEVAPDVGVNTPETIVPPESAVMVDPATAVVPDAPLKKV